VGKTVSAIFPSTRENKRLSALIKTPSLNDADRRAILGETVAKLLQLRLAAWPHGNRRQRALQNLMEKFRQLRFTQQNSLDLNPGPPIGVLGNREHDDSEQNAVRDIESHDSACG